jgi:hypothetical protein
MVQTQHVEGVQERGSRESKTSALDKLTRLVMERRGTKDVPQDFGAFERDLHAQIMEVEREILAEEMARADVDADAIEVNGVVYRKSVRCSGEYFTAAGPVRVERTLYRDRTTDSPTSLSPMELRLGIVEGRWTPHAANLATWVVSQLTPGVSEELFKRIGNMTPSKSTLDRLPKTLLGWAEDERVAFEARLMKEELVPQDASTVAVSLDGVLAPMNDTDKAQTRAETAAAGKPTKGPAGYREVGVGTLTMYDAAGEVLRVVRLGRMPEFKKETLKTLLQAELTHVLRARPDLTLVKVADGAKDNWEFLTTTLPAGLEVLDFYHAAEYLSAAYGAAYGDGSVKARRAFETKRHILRHEEDGVETVIRSLEYLARKHPRRARITRALGYFRAHRRRMDYAGLAARNLPIGSGIVEASCKTLVAQRLKLSGMRWGADGGQAILNLRAWHQSDRFDKAWALIAAQYKAEITTLTNVIALHP